MYGNGNGNHFGHKHGITNQHRYIKIAWLALEYIRPGASASASDATLGEQLAQQHRATNPAFGWHRDHDTHETTTVIPWLISSYTTTPTEKRFRIWPFVYMGTDKEIIVTRIGQLPTLVPLPIESGHTMLVVHGAGAGVALARPSAWGAARAWPIECSIRPRYPA